MKIAFAKPGLPKQGAAVVCVLEGKVLCASAQSLDEATSGALSRAVKAGRFEGKKEQTLVLVAPSGVDLSRVVLVGLGKAQDLTPLAFQKLGGVAAAKTGADKEATFLIDPVEGSPTGLAEAAANAAFGAKLASYRFDKYRTKEKKEDKPALKKFTLACAEDLAAKKGYAPLAEIAEGVFLTRDLVSEPANVIYPETMAEKAKALEKFGVEVEVLGEKEMRKLGMGALLGVGQGSVCESKLAVMVWNGAKDKKAKPVAFVGKGVTFDSGGISIKPSASMEDMKWDMGGAGVVIGLMRALAGRKAAVNAVGVIGLVENMPSGSAQRPGDVVTSMSGQTIEVINTDAEGRLVLADALHYTQDRFKPATVIDLATLTGAIIIALGNSRAGLFANDDALAQALSQAGEAVGEPVWRMPLGEEYDEMIKSDIADMKNVGERGAGSITAAQFLQRFIEKDRPWAHLDIAGVTWSKKGQPIVPKGGTAFGVRLLDRLVAERYEDR